MKCPIVILGVVLLLGALYPVAAKPVPKLGEILRLKFTKGKDYFVEVTTTTVQKIKVKDNDIGQSQNQTFVIQISPESQNVDGAWLVGLQVVGMRFEAKIGGNDIAYDSNKKMQTSPMHSYFDALRSTKFKATIGTDGVIRKLEGQDEFVKSLTVGSSHATLLQTMLKGDAIKHMVAPVGEFLPVQPERVGESWMREYDLELGPIGRYSRQSKFVYHGKVGGVHEIRSAITMKYQPPEDDDARLPFKVISAKITKSDGQATYRFDADLGRLKESALEFRLIGIMQIRVGDTHTNVDIDQTQTQKVRTLEKNPLAT